MASCPVTLMASDFGLGSDMPDLTTPPAAGGLSPA
jgi:hypothetical protein